MGANSKGGDTIHKGLKRITQHSLLYTSKHYPLLFSSIRTKEADIVLQSILSTQQACLVKEAKFTQQTSMAGFKSEPPRILVPFPKHYTILVIPPASLIVWLVEEL